MWGVSLWQDIAWVAIMVAIVGAVVLAVLLRKR